jgi:endoglucanase
MYSFHFYAAEHQDRPPYDYFNALKEASNSLPIFVTEWGTQMSSGGGVNDVKFSERYIKLMAEKKISWINWNYSDDPLSGAVFKEDICPNGPWTGNALKPAGEWIQKQLKEPADDFPVN